MNRKLIDVEMEQTGEALRSPSYKSRQIRQAGQGAMRTANSSIVQSRMKTNPATGQGWLETPSAEYQSWEDKNRKLDLEDRKTTDNQTIDFNLNFLNKVRTKANDEINRSLGNELQTRNKALGDELATRLPYATFEKSADLFGGAKTLASAMGSFDTLRYQKGVSMSL